MNVKTLMAAAVFSAFASGAALAQEATPDTWQKVSSSASREQVRNEAVTALKAGQIEFGEASRGFDAPSASGLSRAQVLAETREAQRLGLVHYGEAQVRVASAADLESIRVAGLRAVDSQMAKAK